jgi:hypothetical protein
MEPVVEIVWSSAEAKEIYDQIQAEIVKAFSIPAHLLQSKPYWVWENKRRAVLEATAYLQEQAFNLYMYNTFSQMFADMEKPNGY